MEDRTMTKKYYIAPELEILDAETEAILMVSPVTTGLDGQNLTKDDTPGDSWSGAMGRDGLWDEE